MSCIMLCIPFNDILQHDAICKFPSKRFYGKKLETDDSVLTEYRMFLQKNRLLMVNPGFWMAGEGSPIMFCNVEGTESSGKRISKNVALQSKTNKMEADCMVRVYGTKCH